ncbi:cytochrome C [Geobacter hydrogenophilus]|uniref:Cytochrome c n=1 Tax=Geobacter hydrogenophilus TaxID=40983 RepID=A0A9W6G136_9BACT|nr:cytochrome C [Geobacter hydrogenophilus]MBT0894131.1 cytochrome C [Geobacter hydrogenophilus]GLI38586.1 cytochrome c [Geobacter hydrogenophilus]
MKKRFLATAVMAAIMAWGAIVNAGNQNIRWTVHNLSSTLPAGATLDRHWYSDSSANGGTDQVCIFCHTPHHAQPAQPLWNKVNPTQAFNMYTSSSTLSSVARKATAPGPESLLCLSCHDGRTAINVIHNGDVGADALPADGGRKVINMSGWGGYNAENPNHQALAMEITLFGTPYRANLGKTGTDGDARFAGTNLMDDHPISFSYAAAQSEKGSAVLNSIESAKSAGLRFFGPNRDRMECSTCHDPHVDSGLGYDGLPTGSGGNNALRPFLVRDNVGSAMCLACHNK